MTADKTTECHCESEEDQAGSQASPPGFKCTRCSRFLHPRARATLVFFDLCHRFLLDSVVVHVLFDPFSRGGTRESEEKEKKKKNPKEKKKNHHLEWKEREKGT